jgi:hypothetical protein
MIFPNAKVNAIRLSLFVAALALQLSNGISVAAAQDTVGTKTWGGYTFTWKVDLRAGVSINNVSFNGTTYINRASMPVIRVEYDPGRCRADRSWIASVLTSL